MIMQNICIRNTKNIPKPPQENAERENFCFGLVNGPCDIACFRVDNNTVFILSQRLAWVRTSGWVDTKIFGSS